MTTSQLALVILICTSAMLTCLLVLRGLLLDIIDHQNREARLDRLKEREHYLQMIGIAEQLDAISADLAEPEDDENAPSGLN